MKLNELLKLMEPEEAVCIRVMSTFKIRQNWKIIPNHDHEVIRGLVKEVYEEKWVDKAYLERDVDQIYSYWDEHTCGDEVIQRWSGITIYISGMEIEKA